MAAELYDLMNKLHACGYIGAAGELSRTTEYLESKHLLPPKIPEPPFGPQPTRPTLLHRRTLYEPKTAYGPISEEQFSCERELTHDLVYEYAQGTNAVAMHLEIRQKAGKIPVVLSKVVHEKGLPWWDWAAGPLIDAVCQHYLPKQVVATTPVIWIAELDDQYVWGAETTPRRTFEVADLSGWRDPSLSEAYRLAHGVVWQGVLQEDVEAVVGSLLPNRVTRDGSSLPSSGANDAPRTS